MSIAFSYRPGGAEKVEHIYFLPRDAILSAVYAVVVCLCVCVCLSVCLCVCHTQVLYQNK